MDVHKFILLKHKEQRSCHCCNFVSYRSYEKVFDLEDLNY